MVLQEAAGVPRINARESDVFDIFNLKHYLGPNPYLNTAAFTFDFALTQCPQPLPIDVYLSKVCFHFPQLQEGSYPSYAHLFARLVAEVNRLQMDLHLQRWSCHPVSRVCAHRGADLTWPYHSCCGLFCLGLAGSHHPRAALRF
jgi:cyanophycin synthetase